MIEWHGITCVLSLKNFHPISELLTRIIFPDIKYLPIIASYDNVETNALVMGSKPVVVILIQWHYMCNFPVNLSPNF